MEVDVSKMTYTQEELEEMGEALLLAHDIKKNEEAHRLVQKYLKDKGMAIEEVTAKGDGMPYESKVARDMAEKKPVRSIADLRAKLAKGE